MGGGGYTIRRGGKVFFVSIERGKLGKRWSFLSIILHKLAKSSCIGLIEISF